MHQIHILLISFLIISLKFSFANTTFKLVNREKAYFGFKDLTSQKLCNFDTNLVGLKSPNLHEDILPSDFGFTDGDYWELELNKLFIHGTVKNKMTKISILDKSKGVSVLNNQIKEDLYACLKEVNKNISLNNYKVQVESNSVDTLIDLSQPRYLLPWAFDVLPSVESQVEIKINQNESGFYFIQTFSDNRDIFRLLSSLHLVDDLILITVMKSPYNSIFVK